jgi:adenosylmethionine-8-amino-7-oxononanoate aminotransferase
LKAFKNSDILLIADEVFTGFGRTGKMFASEHMTTQPDIMCFSKGLTAGMLPMGLTTAAEFIYDVFLSSDATKTFFHGHSFTGNPLGCSVAIASLELFKIENTISKIETINSYFRDFEKELSRFSFICNVAVLGTMLRFELDINNKGYLSTIKSDIIHFYRKKGIMIRPLGNIIYFLPPYCVSQNDLSRLFDATIDFLQNFEKNER